MVYLPSGLVETILPTGAEGPNTDPCQKIHPLRAGGTALCGRVPVLLRDFDHVGA